METHCKHSAAEKTLYPVSSSIDKSMVEGNVWFFQWSFCFYRPTIVEAKASFSLRHTSKVSQHLVDGRSIDKLSQLNAVRIIPITRTT